MQENLTCVRVITSVTHRARGNPVLVQSSPPAVGSVPFESLTVASLLAVNSTHSHQRQSSNDILSCTSHIWSSHTKYSSSSLASGTGARNPAHHLLVDRKWSNYKIKSDFTGNFCGKHVGLWGVWWRRWKEFPLSICVWRAPEYIHHCCRWDTKA